MAMIANTYTIEMCGYMSMSFEKRKGASVPPLERMYLVMKIGVITMYRLLRQGIGVDE